MTKGFITRKTDAKSKTGVIQAEVSLVEGGNVVYSNAYIERKHKKDEEARHAGLKGQDSPAVIKGTLPMSSKKAQPPKKA